MRLCVEVIEATSIQDSVRAHAHRNGSFLIFDNLFVPILQFLFLQMLQ